MKDKIINLIKKNRISATEVADALGKSGVLEGYLPINEGQFVVGEVQYFITYNESNWPLHEQAVNAEENKIYFVDSFNCNDKAIFGDLVAKYLLLYKNGVAAIVNGKMRDIPNLIKNKFPIWCKGYTPLGCFNKDVEKDQNVLNYETYQKEQINGSILVADDSGCTIINKSLINENTLKKLELIELQEDIWFYCIDTLQWNTYDTVCLKKYLDQADSLPDMLKEKVKSINFEK